MKDKIIKQREKETETKRNKKKQKETKRNKKKQREKDKKFFFTSLEDLHPLRALIKT